MKNYYFVCNVVKDGKYHATVVSISDCVDALAVLSKYHDALICPNKRKAEEVAELWNNGYRNNGCNLY